MKATQYLWLSMLTAASTAAFAQQPVIGLITKTETNPFFVKMKEGAQQEANAKGAKLLSGAGKADGDNAGQVTHMENMITAGAKTILITPSDSKAIVPSIQKARAGGVMVIALDSPTDPQNATDALFATDNYKAGLLIGQYAKAAMKGKTVKIATLDLFPGHPVGAQRHNGFLKGFGATSLPQTSNELASARRSGVHAGQLRRPVQGADRHGELPAEEPGHQSRLYHQRARCGRRVPGAEVVRARRRA